jgi:glycerol kinase
MQLQADLGSCPVDVAAETETTGLGAAALAGLAVGAWRDVGEVGSLIRRGARYEPRDGVDVAALRDAWRHALRQATAP